MKELLRKLRAIFAKWSEQKYKTIYVEDVPEAVRENCVYIVGYTDDPWCVVLKCPCGCKNNIQLNLLKESTPRWRLSKIRKGGITIFPSIWRTRKCQSHFFITRSKIRWVK